MALLWAPREGDRLLTEHDVTAAHIAAPHMLALWQTYDARKWRRLSLNLILGAMIPLFGYLVLDWPSALVLMALALDIWILTICDILRLLLAGRRVEQERAHLAEAHDVRSVIDALRRPRTFHGRDLLAAEPPRAYYLSLPGARGGLGSEWGAAIGQMVVMSIALFASCYLFTSMPGASLASTEIALLAGGAVLRLIACAIETIRMRADPAPHPELLPQAALPSLSLSLMGPLLIGTLEFLESFGVEPGHEATLGLALLLYVVLVTGFGLFGLASVRSLLRELKTFAAQDREQMRQRVRRVNG